MPILHYVENEMAIILPKQCKNNKISIICPRALDDNQSLTVLLCTEETAYTQLPFYHSIIFSQVFLLEKETSKN
jgi:hypothetical protein